MRRYKSYYYFTMPDGPVTVYGVSTYSGSIFILILDKTL